MHTKYHGHNPLTRNKCNRQQDNNYIVNIAVDEILLHENQKVSAEREAPETVDSDFDDNDLYPIDKMIIEDIKKKLE